MGLYKHKSCDQGHDCYMYDFCEDGQFTYWYSDHLLGSATLTGEWSRNGDTLLLRADPYLFETETNIISRSILQPDSLTIKVGLLPKYFKDQRDTTWLPWQIMLNDEEKIYQTDQNGLLKIKYRPVEKMVIRDFSFVLGNNSSGVPAEFKFQLNETANIIEAFLAFNHAEPLIVGVEEELLIRGRKLVQISADSLNIPKNISFKKIKSQCGSIKNK